MPYIKPILRNIVQADYAKRPPKNPGELNYVLSDIVDDYLTEDFSYTRINDVMGVLACIQAEVYRRIAAPYEDKKIEENGEVFYTTRLR